MRLHAVAAGQGPLVVLLHGFPECWFSWRYQLPALAAAGFHAIALDLRGYNLSSKPSGLEAYTLPRLVDDVAAVIGDRRAAAVVGHDWGGVLAWTLAERYPERLERLIVLNAPHPRTFARYLRTHPTQALRSWYMLLFQLPWLPERVIRAGLKFWPVLRAPEYALALSQPGAPTASINYYRAIFRLGLRLGEPRPIAVPTLIIWGQGDPFLEAGLAHLHGGRVERLPGAGHWPHLRQPARVSELLIAELRRA